nr:class I SAM-dependent methyltransferase [uncultured Psychroserpens sp.]
MIPKHFVKRIVCPVCQSTSVKTVYETSYENEDIKTYLDDFYNPQGGVEHAYLKDALYLLNLCKDCDLVFQEQIPNDNLMYKLYEEWIDAKIVIKDQEKYPLWYYEKYAKEVINLISYFKVEPNNLKFLDFGMGWGKWCLMTKAFGCQVYGLELSKARIDYATSNGIQVLTNTDLKNHTFDFINTDQVFEHIPNPMESLKELLKCLKPNGIIKISVPNGNNIEEVLQKMDWKAPKGHVNSVNVIAPLEHINCFKTKTIITMAELCGLEEIDIPNVRQHYTSKKDFIKKTMRDFNKKKVNSTTLFFKFK